MEAFLSTATQILTAAIGWVGQVVNMFMSTPLFLVPLLVFFIIGGSVGILKRCF